jgi:hypothetical protein
VGRERHANVRKGQIGYPSRAIRTTEYLYIINLAPDRWPAGDPDDLPDSPQGTYGDIDAGPTKKWMIQNRNSTPVAPLWPAAFEKRPAEELYDLRKDPAQMKNVSGQAEYADARRKLASELEAWRKSMADPAIEGGPTYFDRYPYYGKKAR